MMYSLYLRIHKEKAHRKLSQVKLILNIVFYLYFLIHFVDVTNFLKMFRGISNDFPNFMSQSKGKNLENKWEQKTSNKWKLCF